MLIGKFARTGAASRILFALAALASVPALYGQAVSIASVTGRIQDEQGASMSGAQVRMTGVDTGVIYTAVSNSDGIYTFPSLPIGGYTLESTVSGFETYVVKGIVLRVNDHAPINITFKVAP
jgi:Carboxypeptidase regulatory-like domain